MLLCVTIQWMSNAQTVLGGTIFAGIVPFNLTSAPFHGLACWTGRHFAPVSLYSLGIVLFLGHDGVPCPLTVEVCVYSLHQLCSLMTLHITIRARKQSRKLGTPIPLPQQTAGLLPPPSLHNSKDIQGLSTTLFEPLMDHPTKGSHHVHTAKLGNPYITVVHNSGIFDIEILYCICTNAMEKDEQLMNVGSFLQQASSKLTQLSVLLC